MNGTVGILRIGILITLLSCMVVSVEAKETGDSVKALNAEAADVEVEEIVVTAKKTGRAYEEPVFSRLTLPKSSTAETVFTSKDIEQINPETVFEIIDLAPNLVRRFSNSMNPDGFRSRGGEVIGLIIDGIYVPSTESARMLENFPVTIIDSIRIVRDSTALTLGPLATISASTSKPNSEVDGYIIITTKKPKKQNGSSRLGYDTAQTMQASASFGDVKEDFYYSIAFNHSDTPEWDEHNDARKTDSFHLRGGYSGDSLLANISLYADFANWDCPRYDNNGELSEAIWGFDPSNTMMVSFDTSKLWNKNNTTTFSFGYSEVKSTLYEDYVHRDSSILRNGKNAPMKWHLDEHIYDFNVGHTLVVGNNTLKIGTQALFWDMHDMQGWKYRDKEEEAYGFYFTDAYSLTEKLTLDIGGRIDRRHTIKQNDSKFDDTWAENNTSVAVGQAYQLNDIFRVTTRVSYSEQPAYDWLLKADESKSFESDQRTKYEAGVTANFHPAFNIDGSVFYYDIQNYKYLEKSQTNTVSGETEYLYGEADLTQSGFEISVSGDLSANFSYSATYSYLHIDDESVSKLIPENSATVMLNYQYADYFVNITTKYLDEYSQTATQGDGLGDYIRVDASVSKQLTQKTKITLYAKNLTNDEYAEACMTSYVSGMYGYIYNRGAIFGLTYSMDF